MVAADLVDPFSGTHLVAPGLRLPLPPSAEIYPLPPPSGPVEGLLALPAEKAARATEEVETESALAEAKAALDPYEHDRARIRIFGSADYLGHLRGRVIRELGAECVTNAWLKLAELVSHLGLFSEPSLGCAPSAELKVLFGAELPGAWIGAVNHLLATALPGVRFNWAASSLHPGEGEALEDTFGLLARHPGRWLMDAEMPGDLTKLDDVHEVARRAKKRLGGEADLCLADGGIALTGPAEYAAGEALAAPLLTGQVLLGVLTVRRGGGLVVKTGSFLRPESICLLSFCAGLFDQSRLVKPEASRDRNSETYCAFQGFRGCPPAGLRALEAALAGGEKCFLPIGASELAAPRAALLAAATEMARRQRAALQTLMALFHHFRRNPAELAKHPALLQAAERAGEAWWAHYAPGPLHPRCRLVRQRRR